MDAAFMLSVTVHAVVLLLVIAAVIRLHVIADAPPVSANSKPFSG
jgi:hypothetical protein